MGDVIYSDGFPDRVVLAKEAVVGEIRSRSSELRCSRLISGCQVRRRFWYSSSSMEESIDSRLDEAWELCIGHPGEASGCWMLDIEEIRLCEYGDIGFLGCWGPGTESRRWPAFRAGKIPDTDDMPCTGEPKVEELLVYCPYGPAKSLPKGLLCSVKVADVGVLILDVVNIGPGRGWGSRQGYSSFRE